MKIIDLQLETSDLNRILDFYQHTLGLTTLEQTDTTVRFQAGDTQLSFTANNTSKARYHFAFNIATNHLEQAIAWAQANNIDLLPSPKNEIITHFDTWKAQSIYFWDLDSNLLEFIAREDIQIAKGKAFSPKEILNISEIGLVTNNPIETAEAINQQLGTEFFSKSTPLPEFCAIGDDQGLLVLVAPTRTWYPTPLLAEKSPATLQLESQGNIHTIQTMDWD
ncbi:VOC family protein [Myroides odoratus]|uniref:VOC family protein n=1 Tax=Myroides odoratus TaxID=256 RepID=UPI0039AEDB63